MTDHNLVVDDHDSADWQDVTACKLPVFDLDEVKIFIQDHYGIPASLKLLNGERDLNYLVCAENEDAGRFVFKVCNEQESRSILEFQTTVMERIATHSRYKSIQSVPAASGKLIEKIVSKSGATHDCRLTTYLEGDLFSAISPKSPRLFGSLGEAVAEFGMAVGDLDPKSLDRPLLWHMENSPDVIDKFSMLITQDDKKQLIAYSRALFITEVVANQQSLPRGIIHNDANDNNIVVTNAGPWEQSVKGLIDLGDMVYCWKVTDLAVACAYAVMQVERPLDVAVQIIRGYHKVVPLEEAEIAALFPMILMRLAMSVCICARQKTIEPDNHYLSVSELPAWQMLENLSKVTPKYAQFLFREACGFSAVSQRDQVVSWLQKQDKFSQICDLPDLTSEMLLLDASVSSPHLDNVSGSGYDVVRMQRSLDRALEDAAATTGIGRYNEYRLIYQSDDFTDATGHRRTLHLGIDIFQPAGACVYCPLDASVHSVANNDEPFDYGGAVVLRHDVFTEAEESLTFYTLYGHLSPASISNLSTGAVIKAGDLIGKMGQPSENGNWPPHVHFQIIMDMLDEVGTFVGVGSHAHRNIWLALCPDPNLILRLPATFLNQPLSDAIRTPDDIYTVRVRVIPDTLSLSYRQPVSIARGAGQYLYDFTGRQYLDAVNNVPHVGHCHPHVVAAQRNAAGVLNTNTRYLYRGLGEYAERLLEKFPKPLSKVFLVNSGSEANDLALRMAFCHTNRSEVVALEHGYHGNLGSLIDISGYKHDGPGGKGSPKWVHKAPVPDLYRSVLPADASGVDYAASIKALLEQERLEARVAAFICETIPGCGGQLMLPRGYLSEVYKLIRASGAVCIADEVQTGFGRVGSHFWAFEMQSVVPDIVTLGKPAGNGHPIGAVITTDAIAASFTNGMEYFNTFGGNPVSCAVGNAVLDVLDMENLQLNARKSGAHLLSGLKNLSLHFPIIGDVRGSGLFIGVELVEDRETLVPAEHQASYIAERMKQEGVFISTDGPWHNVLKIKPPIVFDDSDGDFLVAKLEMVLSERWSQPHAFSASSDLATL